MIYKECTEYLFNDYDAAKKNNKPEFIYNNFETLKESMNKI